MTTEAATAFVERLKTDEALQSKLAAAASRAERLALAREEGFDLSAGDAGAVRQALGIEELSDDDLDKVAGGMGMSTAADTAVVSLASVSSVASVVTAVVAATL